jgi:hypothetical protein
VPPQIKKSPAILVMDNGKIDPDAQRETPRTNKNAKDI